MTLEGEMPSTIIILINVMSLISQMDRQMVIEALEFYIQRLKEDNCTEASIYAYNTLLRWIELEYFKNEN
jgi:hypothetical protein